jgi:hypothetical protein
MSGESSRRVVAGITVLGAFALMMFLILVVFGFGVALFEVLGLMPIGWIWYLARVLPQIELNWEMIACGLAGLVLGTLMLDRLFKWVWRQGKSESPWRPAWTVCLVTLTLLLFANAMALTGIFHHAGALLRELGTSVHRHAAENEAHGHGRVLYVSLLNYTGDHGGRFPDTLDEIIPDYLDTTRPFLYRPAGAGDERRRFTYIPGHSTQSSASAIILYTPTPPYWRHVVVYLDGRAESITAKQLEADLQLTERVLLGNQPNE